MNNDGPIGFVCPKCGNHNLTQYMVNVDVETPVTMGNDGHIMWGVQTNSGNIDVIGFLCENGHFLKDPDGRSITTDDELTAWFGKENNE